MFSKVEIDHENCLMFEWVKNVLQSDKISLVSVPKKHEKFRVFIDNFYDEKKESKKGNLLINIFLYK